jgi:hypothetical protein
LRGPRNDFVSSDRPGQNQAELHDLMQYPESNQKGNEGSADRQDLFHKREPDIPFQASGIPYSDIVF